MRVRVTMNQPRLNRLSDAQIQALIMTADAVKTDVMTGAVVPKQTGELERSAHIDDSKARTGRVKLIYDARRLYWHPEFNFRSDKNANARGKWLEPWIDGNKKEFARRTFRELYRRVTGGVLR